MQSVSLSDVATGTCFLDPNLTVGQLEDGLNTFENELLREELGAVIYPEVLLRNLGAVQLTAGCSVGCSFCGFNAAKTVGEQMSWRDVLNLVVQARRYMAHNRTFGYWASDPFDWQCRNWDGRTYLYPDLHRLIKTICGYSPYVSTSVPKGKEELVWAHRSIVDRVSLTRWNRRRLTKRWSGEMFELWGTKVKDMDRQINSRLNAAAPAWTSEQPIDGIGCFNGTLVRPDCWMSVLQLGSAERYVECQVVQRLDMERLLQPIPSSNEELARLSDALERPPLEALLTVAVPRHCHIGQDPAKTLVRKSWARECIVELQNSTGSAFFQVSNDGAEVKSVHIS